MKNVLFVLIDAIDSSFYQRYQHKLCTIHKNLLKKLSNYDMLVVGSNHSCLTDQKFSNAKSMYEFIARQSKDRDIIICDAWAGLLSLEDTESVWTYLNVNQYDICFTENLPEGLVPSVISHEFINDLYPYIDDEKTVDASLKDLMNWEYKGIDVGVYLSDSLLIMERIEFLPVSKGSVDYIAKLSSDFSVSLADIDDMLLSNKEIVRNNPQYLALELSSQSDGFYTKKFSDDEMDREIFRKIITEVDELCPEALISLGVWGDPFTHSQFKELFEMTMPLPNKILVETRSQFLSEELVNLVLSRPNTELIFEVSFVSSDLFNQNKNSVNNLMQISKFIKSLPKKDHIWVRLTRSPETEEEIPLFMKEWKEFMPRILITKADSFGKDQGKVVDLAPIRRHPCYMLRRELTILNNGSILLCRQSDRVIGNLSEESLASIWNKNNEEFKKQQNQQYDNCTQCQLCDDWWIWN